jgi:hypothetical protein
MTEVSPWTHFVAWPGRQAAPLEQSIVADEPTRHAVARFLGLEDLARLSARLTIQPWLDGAEIAGNIEARFTRLCGLTLEPFESRLEEPLLLRALPAGSPHAPPSPADEVDLGIETEDPPDVLGLEGVDLGDLVVQTLALALDPFPRKPGAVFEAPQTRPEDSPFGVLARLNEPKD